MQSNNPKKPSQTDEKDPATAEVINHFGDRFGAIVTWAADRDLLFQLEISYRILGLDPYTIAIANLPLELSHAESKMILDQWSDSTLLQGLSRFTTAFYADESIAKKYPRIAPAGNYQKIPKQFQPYASQKFLLALITLLLHGQPDSDKYIDRRRLRIWLLAQAAQRLVRHGCAAEKSISSVARFLVMSPSDKRWDVVDELLKATREALGKGMESESFYPYTLELGRSAANLKYVDKFTDRSRTLFLNSVISVAAGECNPTEEIDIAQPLRGLLTAELQDNSRPKTVDVLSAEPDFPVALLVEIEGSEDEEGFYAVTQIDPTDSPEQQAVSSGSVFLQTAEQAHYLPWSWDRVLPIEVQALESWMVELLDSKNLIERTGAAFVWLATRLARSLELTGRVTITQDLTAEWAFSPDFAWLKRTAPRRLSSWRAAEPVADLLAPYRNDLTVQVPVQVTKIFQEAIQTHPEAKTLHGIWRVVCDQKLEVWFNAQAREHFPRITSAKLAVYQSQRLFNIFGQPCFTRLLSSHPQSALPAACSYTTWNTESVEKGLGLLIQKTAEMPEHIGVMGSQLCPLDEVLAVEIERCKQKLDEAHGKDLIQYHNMVAQYVVTALYAATGGRPLQDPFETASYFSTRFQCVFIADKNDDEQHTGRVVPLPARALQLYKQYLQYLAKLETKLQVNQPEFSAQIRNLIQGLPAELPLFFLLDQHLQWHSMASADSLGCKLFDLKLPANLFRHRYAQCLLSHGVDPEVVEGWMGHAERGVASYADYSVRCWKDDAETYKPVYEAAYDSLPFSSTLQLKDLPPLLYIPMPEGKQSEPKAFGQQARDAQRSLKDQKATDAANTAIELFLAKRELSDLSDEELSKLCDHMLLREDGLPHTYAALRFDVLLGQLRELGTEGVSPESVRHQLLTKRIVRLSEERSLIQPNCIQALELYAVFQEWSEQTAKKTTKGSLSKRHALCIGAALLAVEKRLCYKQMLLDIYQGQNFRIIQVQKTSYLEYSENLNPEDFSTPVQRHEISYKTASFLVHGLHARKKVVTPELEDIKALKPLAELLNKNLSLVVSVENCFDRLCEVINQANLLQLPGVIAAALSGRTQPTSLSIQDRMRVERNLVLEQNTSKPTKPPELTPISTRAYERTSHKSDLQESAKNLGREIYEELKVYEKKSAKDCARKIKKITKGYRYKVSSSLLLLAYWLAHKAETGMGGGKTFQPYAQNTLSTYWSSLIPAFRGHLYEIDLVALDSDGVTEVCSKMLTHKWQQGQDASYLGERLVEFFRWASQSGVATPEWSELNLNCKDRTVSPGFITESEYQSCQEKIRHHPVFTTDQKLMLGFVLLLAYRFGLRLSEATGLLRRDWLTEGGDICVLVEENQYRTLKSEKSRRAVPLLFSLTELEQDLIRRTLLRYESYAGKDESRPILCEASSKDDRRLILAEEMINQVSPTLIQLIRQVTHNTSHVLHHARHSFFNRIAPAILGFNTEFSNKLCNQEEHEAIRRRVLGPIHSHSRRSGMAMARLMGHAFVSTGFKNYFHLATDWADALTPVSNQRVRKITEAVQIEELSIITVKQAEPASIYRFPTPSLKTIFKVLRLVSLGATYERAGEAFELNPRYSKLLKENFGIATSNMRFTSELDSSIKIRGAENPKALLESITSSGWLRFFKAAENLDKKNTSKNKELYSQDLIDSYIVEANKFRQLTDAPSLLGINRNILMEQQEHCDFVKLALEKFSISEDRYTVLVKPRSTQAKRYLENSGFKVKADTNKQLDSFRIYVPQRDNYYRVEDYGGLILKQSPTGVVRDRIDFVLVFLVYSSYLQILQMEHDVIG